MVQASTGGMPIVKPRSEKKRTPPNKRVVRNLLLVFIMMSSLLAFLIGVSLRLTFIVPRYHASFDQQDLGVTLVVPQYVSVGDPNEILVTASNRSGKLITGTQILLTYEGSLPLSSDLAQSNRLDLGELMDGEIKSKVVKFRLEDASGNWLSQATGQPPMRFSLRVGTEGAPPSTVGSLPVLIAPYSSLAELTRLGSSGPLVLLTGCLLWGFKQLWDELGETQPRRQSTQKQRGGP